MMTQTQQAECGTRPFLSIEDRNVIAKVLSWDTCQPIEPAEVITIWMEKDILWTLLTGGRSVPIHKEAFKQIRDAQMGAAAEQYVDEPVHPPLETDCTEEEIHRVWKGGVLHATFFFYEGAWEVEPCRGDPYRCDSLGASLQSCLNSTRRSTPYH